MIYEVLFIIYKFIIIIKNNWITIVPKFSIFQRSFKRIHSLSLSKYRDSWESGQSFNIFMYKGSTNLDDTLYLGKIIYF